MLSVCFFAACVFCCPPILIGAVEPDRSTPEAAFQTLKAACLAADDVQISEHFTANSSERDAMNRLAELLRLRTDLKRGPLRVRPSITEIDQFLVEQGIGQKEWADAYVTASNRPQSDGELVLALVIQNVKHNPRFAAAGQKLLLEILAKHEITHAPPPRDNRQWEDMHIVHVEINGEEARVKAASTAANKRVEFTFRRIGNEWFVYQPRPLPQAIHDIVHASASVIAEESSSSIVVDVGATATPETVYSLAKEALAQEDYHAFAKCLTADSLATNAVVTLFQANVLLHNESSSQVRERLREVLTKAGIDQQDPSTIVVATFTQTLEKDKAETQQEILKMFAGIAEQIKHKPLFCADAQSVLAATSARPLIELFHIRHAVVRLGSRLDDVQLSDDSATGTVHKANGRTEHLQFVRTDDGWRIRLPAPVDKREDLTPPRD